MKNFEDGRTLYKVYVFENSEEEKNVAKYLLEYLNREIPLQAHMLRRALNLNMKIICQKTINQMCF